MSMAGSCPASKHLTAGDTIRPAACVELMHDPEKGVAVFG